MKKRFIGIIAVIMVIMMCLALLVGCGNTGEDKTNSTSTTESKQTEAATVTQAQKLDPAEAVMMLWGDKPAGFDEVMAEFENRTKDTLNMKWDVIWTPLSEYGNKLKLKISAGEQVDCAYDAQWLQLLTFISQGVYTELDQYFNNDQYSGLKNNFNEVMMNTNKFNGHVYGVPFITPYRATFGYYVRKDLREKYALPEIKNYDELEAFFDKVIENEKGMIPLAANGQNEVCFNGVIATNERLSANDNIFVTSLGAQLKNAWVKLSTDRKNVENVYFEGQTDMPKSAGWTDTDELAREWYVKGYFEKDVISQKDKVGLFKAGKAAAVAWDTANYYAVYNDLKKAVPGAEMEFVPGYDEDWNSDWVETYNKKSILKGFNFACIPVTSKNTERVIMFFDWMFSDKANHDLFEYGIEGQNWAPDGDNKYSIPENGTPYNFPGYLLTWNQNMIRFPSGLDNDVIKYMKFKTRSDTYYESPLGDFAFNTEPVKTEMAKAGPVIDDIGKLLTVGLLENPKEKRTEAIEKANKLGLDTIREEVKKQVNAYLANMK